MGLKAWLQRRTLALDPARTLRPLRSSVAAGPKRTLLEEIVAAFVDGYNAALEEESLEHLAERLGVLESRWRGFAFEGAGMALWLLDSLPLSRGERWRSFQLGPGRDHVYLLHVGVGWGIARFRQDWQRKTEAMDPLLRWLALDGLGFHQGLFRSRKHHSERARPPAMSARCWKVFDQGLGRSLWFIHGAEGGRIAESIRSFEDSRRPDLWSGVGLACAYAGGTSPDETAGLFADSGQDAAHFAQGVAFAAAARESSGTRIGHTDDVCRQIWRRESVDVAELVTRARTETTDDPLDERYERWRARIRGAFERPSRTT